ncbi:hypothetical protein C8F01DRAFT_1373985 [Mycena amicta]|nr:hypothetical protein C8F01DRAFT_1373985 [Mycena amicta]
MPSVNPALQTQAIGPLEIGALLAFALFGVTTSQYYTYFCRFPNDSRKLKFFVCLIWLCETTHVVAVGHAVYTSSVLDYNRPEGLIYVPTSILVSFFANRLNSAFIQAFFGLRIYRLDCKPYYKLVPFVIWILAAAQFVLAFSPVVAVAHPGPIALIDFLTEENWSVYSTLSISIACDFLVVVGLVYCLWRRRVFAQNSTLVIVDKLIAWTIETGLITSTAVILELILFCTNAFNWHWLAIDCLLSGLFSNTLLANLNSRATLRAIDQPSAIDFSVQLSTSMRRVSDSATSETMPGSRDRSCSQDKENPSHALGRIRFDSGRDLEESLSTESRTEGGHDVGLESETV